MTTSEDHTQEIARLQGELSAACYILALAINMSSLGDSETRSLVRRKLTTGIVYESADHHWREGVDRFVNRFLKTFQVMIPDLLSCVIISP